MPKYIWAIMAGYMLISSSVLYHDSRVYQSTSNSEDLDSVASQCVRIYGGQSGTRTAFLPSMTLVPYINAIYPFIQKRAYITSTINSVIKQHTLQGLGFINPTTFQKLVLFSLRSETGKKNPTILHKYRRTMLKKIR